MIDGLLGAPAGKQDLLRREDLVMLGGLWDADDLNGLNVWGPELMEAAAGGVGRAGGVRCRGGADA